MAALRGKVRQIVYAIGISIVALLLLRFGLRLLGVPDTNIIVNVIYQLSYIFVTPFLGIAVDISSGTSSVEFSTVISILMYIGFSLLFAELLTAFMYESLRDILLNFVNVVFKFVEFFLLARLLMRAFGVQLGVNGFVDAVYNVAGIVYTPFAGIAPGIPVSTGVIEISTLMALVIVVVLDLVTDGFLRALLPEPVENLDKPAMNPGTTIINNAPPAAPTTQFIPASQPVAQPQVNVFIPAQQPQPSAQPVVIDEHGNQVQTRVVRG